MKDESFSACGVAKQKEVRERENEPLKRERTRSPTKRSEKKRMGKFFRVLTQHASSAISVTSRIESRPTIHVPSRQRQTHALAAMWCRGEEAGGRHGEGIFLAPTWCLSSSSSAAASTLATTPSPPSPPTTLRRLPPLPPPYHARRALALLYTASRPSCPLLCAISERKRERKRGDLEREERTKTANFREGKNKKE